MTARTSEPKRAITLESIREAVREDSAQPETWKDRNGSRLRGWRRSEVHRRVLLDWVERMRTHVEINARLACICHASLKLCLGCEGTALLRELEVGSDE